MILLIYNFDLKKSEKFNDSMKNCVAVFLIIFILSFATGQKYTFNYKLDNYKDIQEVINYTSNNKQNVYLYTVPSLQFRYLAYPVYQMPPKESFSNLRVIGGWDMYTENYYDFNKRYNLEGNFKDLLNENVYLIDGDVVWGGNYYSNYKKHVFLALEEHYDIDVECDLVKEFGNYKIYKVKEKQKELVETSQE